MLGKMSVTVTLLTVLAAATVAKSADAIPDLPKCHVADREVLNACLFQTLQLLRPGLKTGIRALNLPRLEPMTINNIVFRQDQGLVKMQSRFENVIVAGLSNYTTKFIDANPQTRTLTLSLNIPELRINGSYALKGHFIAFPAEGAGTFWANFRDIDATGTSNLRVVRNPRGHDQLLVSDTQIDFKIRKLNMHLNNLFNDQPILALTVNRFLNDHGQEILQDLKPAVIKELNKAVENVMNDALSQLPVNQFLIL